MELVSIIVPVYNTDKYLYQCVKSLLNQTYADIESILVDDGSKDDSGRICNEFAKKYQRIKVIHKENAGLGYARNSGLKLATGKYVTFIDSDDWADPDLIQKLIMGLKESEADTCIGGFKRVRGNESIQFKEHYEKKIYRDAQVYNELFARMLGSSPNAHDAIKMSVWNVLYSMEIIQKNQIEFPSERKFISEDIMWDFIYFQKAKAVQVIDSIAYNYRITPGSLTQKYKPNMLEMICFLYEEMEMRLNGDQCKIVRLQRQFFVNLRLCIRQEGNQFSGKTTQDIILGIKDIVNHSTVVRIVNEYPLNNIHFRAKIFLLLVKYKRIRTLELFVNLKKI